MCKMYSMYLRENDGFLCPHAHGAIWSIWPGPYLPVGRSFYVRFLIQSYFFADDDENENGAPFYKENNHIT